LKISLSIVVPSFLTIILFIISIYALVIPSFERNMMERKKEMISELTNTAWSLVSDYFDETQKKLISMEEAMQMAASKIEKMRYGPDQKDYFWISDMRPAMIMHPYRKELIGSELSTYQDPNGKKLFVEAVKAVEGNGEGYIDYFWQWKDDSTRIVPKLSYVKGFQPWGWIIGTGIYIEDVKEEIADLEKRLLRISFFIALLICFLLFYIIRQSLKIERKRKEAENDLLLSRQKYKSLVEASTEGTIMMMGRKIIFANLKMADKLDCNPEEIMEQKFDESSLIRGCFGLKPANSLGINNPDLKVGAIDVVEYKGFSPIPDFFYAFLDRSL
jgi:signal transduction histidine kinase